MKFQRTYQFIFSNPNWVINVLGGAGCMLIPILGWTAVMGYGSEVAESVQKEESSYPSFDLNRMGQYLRRGVGPFVAQFFLSLPVLFLMSLAVVAGVVYVESPEYKINRSEITVILLGTLAALGLVLLFLLVSLVIVPMIIYLGARQELAIGSALAFVPDFFRKVGKELILAEVFVFSTGLSLVVMGTMACCIGTMPALAMAGLAQHHFNAQLLGCYLERGGAGLSNGESRISNE